MSIRCALLLSLALLTQQRDVTAPRVGTGEISGVIISADTSPQPVRRVVVSISGDLSESRSVITDDAGRFVFSRLPAGRFTIGARKVAYLPAQYGATKPGRAGSAVALAAGEKRQVSITIFRGAVIAGILRDSTGAPLPAVTVAAIDTRLRAMGGIESPAQSTLTDDRGAYRFYGLPPSEYVIAAAPAPPGTGEIGTRSAAELDALFASLNDRQNRMTPPGTPSPALPQPVSIGYSPVYFPGTPMYADAARIRVAAGEEKPATNFIVTHVPIASIEGTVSGDTPNLAAVTLSITPDSPRLTNVPGTFGITSQPPTATGEFKYGNLAPGRYRIVARARRGPGDPNAPAAPAAVGGLRVGAPPGVNVQAVGDMLYGVADVEIRGQDVRGVSINMQLGGFLSGKLIFDADQAPVPPDITQFRVGVQLVGGSGIATAGTTRVGNALSSVPPVNVKADGTFLITGIGPSRYFVTCQIPAHLAGTWKLRSAAVNGRELLDTNLEGPAVQLSDVAVVLSDKRTELSGTLQSGSGQAVSDYHVVAFSADRANWRPGSRRNLSTRPATNGRFILSDLPAGEYLIAALTDLDPLEWQDASFLEQVAPAAIQIKLAENEKKVQDLKIR